MANETVRVGLKGEFFIGAPGAQAATGPLKNVENVTINGDKAWVDTTRRGSTTETEKPILRKFNLEFTYQARDNDSNWTTIRDAWLNNTGLAIWAQDKNSGEGPDGDYELELKREEPLKGAIKYTFVAKCTDEYGRDPAWT